MVYTSDAEELRASPIRVFLIDEEVVVRAGMRILIDSWPISKVVAEADAVMDALPAISSVKPDLIVYSHNGRSAESLEGLRELIEAAGGAPLVLLTSSRDPKVGAVAVEAGAKWIMLKQNAASELRLAMEKAFSGEVWCNQSVSMDSVVRNGTVDYRNRPELSGPLTSREREVAILVSKGCTNRQVGARLGIAEVTVRHHLSSIFGKLGIANRYELIAWVYRRGSSDPAKLAISSDW